MTTLLDMLSTILSEEEMSDLRFMHNSKKSETKQLALRAFFLQSHIFEKVKAAGYEPTRLAFEIFINGKEYEF
jgi:hypothetical protein